jgi:hypothetical protein
MKRKKTSSRSPVKRRKSRAIRLNLRKGTASCGLCGCLGKLIQPVLKALGWK